MCRSICSNGTLPYLRLHGFGSGHATIYLVATTASIVSKIAFRILKYLELAQKPIMSQRVDSTVAIRNFTEVQYIHDVELGRSK